MLRILHIFYNMGNGGVESFVMNYYRHIDRGHVQFDFLTSVQGPGYFDDEIRALGGRLFHAYPLKRNPVHNYADIVRIVKENHYEIVHRHTGSAIGYYDLHAAKAGGAKTLILHSHASNSGNRLIHMLSQLILKMDCVKFACSREAGEYLFGRGQSFDIINNAIDVAKYSYSPEARAQIRRGNGLSDEIVVGHVGAFCEVKNHVFLLEVLKSLLNYSDKYRLWLVGDGPIKKQIEQRAETLGIQDKVLFWGNRDDVPDLLQAMDLFVLPSIHEGFNIASVEAKCSGLNCFVSAQCAGLDSFVFLPLEDGAQKWAESIVRSTPLENRSQGAEMIKQAHFDIKDAAEELEQRYLSYARK